MNKYLNKPAVIIVLICIFFALTLLISLRYSDNEKGKEKIQQSFLFRIANWGLGESKKNISGGTDNTSSSATETKKENLIDSPGKLATGFKKYINIKRVDSGVTITLQNSRGIFWEKTWQIFPPPVKTEINQ